MLCGSVHSAPTHTAATVFSVGCDGNSRRERGQDAHAHDWRSLEGVGRDVHAHVHTTGAPGHGCLGKYSAGPQTQNVWGPLLDVSVVLMGSTASF